MNSVEGDVVMLNICARKCRTALVIGAVITTLSRTLPQFLLPQLISVALLLFMISLDVAVFSDNLSLLGDETGAKLNNARNVTQAIALAMVCLMVLAWLITNPTLRNIFTRVIKYMIGDDVFNRKVADDDNVAVNEENRDRNVLVGDQSNFAANRIGGSLSSKSGLLLADGLYQSLIVSFLLVSIAIIIAINAIYGGVTHYTLTSLFISDMSFAFLELSILMITMRRTKSEVVQGLESILLVYE